MEQAGTHVSSVAISNSTACWGGDGVVGGAGVGLAVGGARVVDGGGVGGVGVVVGGADVVGLAVKVVVGAGVGDRVVVVVGTGVGAKVGISVGALVVTIEVVGFSAGSVVRPDPEPESGGGGGGGGGIAVGPPVTSFPCCDRIRSDSKTSVGIGAVACAATRGCGCAIQANSSKRQAT